MPEPDLWLDSVSRVEGRSADAAHRCVMTLRGDSEILTLLGGVDDGSDATRVVPATNTDDPDPVQLVVEAIATGSEQRGKVEQSRITIEVAPLITPEAYERSDPDYLETVRDKAVEVLKRENLGPGWSYLGQTNDITSESPRTAEDINALVQYVGRVQFAVQLGDG